MGLSGLVWLGSGWSGFYRFFAWFCGVGTGFLVGFVGCDRVLLGFLVSGRSCRRFYLGRPPPSFVSRSFIYRPLISRRFPLSLDFFFGSFHREPKRLLSVLVLITLSIKIKRVDKVSFLTVNDHSHALTGRFAKKQPVKLSKDSK